MVFIGVLVAIFLTLGLFNILLLRLLHRSWWNGRWVRIAATTLPVFGIVSLLIGMLGLSSSSVFLMAAGITAASLTLILLIGLAVSLPFSGILHGLARLLERRTENRAVSSASNPSMSRRSFLKSSALLFPLAATTTGVTGFVSSFDRVRVYERALYYADLPDQLNGFRILHLSDMHLGRYFRLGDLELTLTDAERFSPDMIALTGDICDVTSMLDDTLKLISQMKPRYGSWASIGNHEYYHGISMSLAAHSRSDTPLLINAGRMLEVNGARLFVGGADDPASLFGDIDNFLRDTVDRTMSGTLENSFRILMSHRPRGFVRAAAQGVELTLAGHTHGGQIGIFGRSIFETHDPPNYYWGHYITEKSQLYTSAGTGHWFPYRIGCPAEAPVLILRKA